MIAHRHPLCDVLRQEHRMIRLSLMAMYIGPQARHADNDDRAAIRAFIGEHIVFEDRHVIPALRPWLPPGWPVDGVPDIAAWQLVDAHHDQVSARSVLRSMSRRLVDEEAVLMPLIERRLSIDAQRELIDVSTRRADHGDAAPSVS